MNISQRVLGTKNLTALAVSWLFLRRECRVIADEVAMNGFGGIGGIHATGYYRADVVGISRRWNNSVYRVDVVEVKGSRDDLRREDLAHGKWARLAEPSSGYNPWLIVSEDVKKSDLAELPARWGVLQAAGGNTTLRHLRKRSGTDIHLGRMDAAAADVIYAVGARTLSSRIPFLGPSVTAAVQALIQQTAEMDPDLVAASGFAHFEQFTPTQSLDEVRMFPVEGSFDLEGKLISNVPDKGEGLSSVVKICDFTGDLIGSALLVSLPWGYSISGSIPFACEERLLLETKDAAPVLEFTLDATGPVVQLRKSRPNLQ